MSEPERSAGPTGVAPTSDGAVPLASGPGPDARTAPGGSEVPLTGDDAVDEALRRLTDVESQDLRTQVHTFEEVHRALQDRLADAEG